VGLLLSTEIDHGLMAATSKIELRTGIRQSRRHDRRLDARHHGRRGVDDPLPAGLFEIGDVVANVSTTLVKLGVVRLAAKALPGC
jgi:hypothetical protein